MAKKKKAEKTNDAEAPQFEEALEKLEGIVRHLEEGHTPLSEALAHYEQGVKYLKHCHQLLENVERRIELLSGVDAEGHPISEPLDDQETSLEEKQSTRSRRRSRGSGTVPE